MAKAPAPKAGGNVFTKKIGPLPGWLWVGAGAGALILFSYSKKSNGASNTTGMNTNEVTGNALAAANYVSASKAANTGATTTAAPDALTTFLAGLVTGANTNPSASTPGNSGTVVTTPGSTGNPVVQTPPVSASAPMPAVVQPPTFTAVAPYSPDPQRPQQLAVGQMLPQATGVANYAIDPGGYSFSYG